METRKSERAPATRPGTISIASPTFCFLISILLLSAVFGGCASPGDPYERKARVSEAVTDLAAAQSGNDVVLTFTLPTETVDHRPLEQPPTVEIYRNFAAPPASGESRLVATQSTLLATIPSAMVDSYATQGRIRYTDSIPATAFAPNAALMASYTVRMRGSENKSSADSNAATLRVYPLPNPIGDLKAEVTHPAIVLTWTPSQTSPAGAAPPIAGYRVYRAEGEPAATGASPNLKSSPALIGEPDAASASFSDSNFEFGKTYVYVIRSVVQTPGGPLLSGDSNALTVAAKDTFPPTAPQGLVVVLVPAQGDAAAHLELSWAISPETDIAGYNVYRSEQVGVLGTRVNAESLLTPAFRDMNSLPGRRYFYSVTAVDRSGNESTPSAAVSGGVPAEGQPAP
ncbi:MAG TPA: hypothetical protein VN822_10560 [Candidatus Acidoferrales bacterium]|nr:hypothetical protein [Candidatus Acidoferrales bacterium]